MKTIILRRRYVISMLALSVWTVLPGARGHEGDRSHVQAENILYTQVRTLTRYHGFNGFINPTTPGDEELPKKFRTLTWGGSVKESATISFQGTQRTEFAGSATFAGATLTNGLLRRDFINMDDPSHEGDGSGGPYIVTGFGGGCWPVNKHNLLMEFPGIPGGGTLATTTEIAVVNPTRRERFGHMNLIWSKIHLPCNLLTYQTHSDHYASLGPVVEELSDPAEGELVSETRLAGYHAIPPVASLVYRMENNSAWIPLSSVPGIVDDSAYECRIQFRLPDGCTSGGTYILHLSVESWDGSSAAAIEELAYAVEPKPSPSGLGEVEVVFDLRAERLGQSKRILSAVLEIDAATCSGCGLEAGAASGRVDSVNWSMNLGALPGGKRAGVIRLKHDEWSPLLHTAAALTYVRPATANPQEAVVRRDDGSLRQIRTGLHLADFLTADDDPTLPEGSYEIRFHAQAGSEPSTDDPSLWVASEAPLSVTRFFDPDGQGSSLAIYRHTGNPSVPSATWEYAYDDATSTWSLTEGGLRRTDKTTSVLSPTEEQILTTVWDLRLAGPVKVSEIEEKHRTYVLGGRDYRVLYERTLDPSGAALRSTWEYAVDARGMLREIASTDHTGAWEKKQHLISFLPGGLIRRIYNTYRPFENSAPDDPVSEQRMQVEEEEWLADIDGDGRAEIQTWTYERIGNIWNATIGRQLTKPVVLNGQVCTVYEQARLEPPFFRTSDPGLRWERHYRYTAEPFNGRTALISHYDGTVETFSYTLDPGTAQVTEVHARGASDVTGLAVVDGTRTTTVTTADGRLVYREEVDIASGLAVGEEETLESDEAGRPLLIRHFDGSTEERTYNPCCGRLMTTSRHGRTTSYDYDELGRMRSESFAGLTLVHTHDALDRVVETVRRGSDDSEFTRQTFSYDLAGRMIGSTDAMGRSTTYEEIHHEDRTTTRITTNPDGSTAIEVTNADGSPARREGTGVAPAHWDYAMTTFDGLPVMAVTEFHGEEGLSSPAWVRTLSNGDGLVMAVEYPDGARATQIYDRAHRLIRRSDPDGVVMLLNYDARGEQTITAIDMNANGVVDYDGTDRITRTNGTVEVRGGTTVWRSTVEQWEADGEAAPVVVSVTDQAADGSQSWQNIRGLESSTRTDFDGTGGRTVTTTAPDGIMTIQVYADDRLSSVVTQHASLGTLASMSYAYDPHGRLSGTTDARNGTTIYTYFADDQVETVTTPDPDPTLSGPGYDAQVTTYRYDSAGRVESVTHPDGGIVNTTYWPTGQVRRTWGTRTYPTEYTYDSQGRIRTLTTWQEFAGDAGQAVTTWNYDPVRGWLNNKRYADNTGPTYTYTSAGRLETRVWARSPTVTTTYSYNAAGEVEHIDYSDDTPDVTFIYDRLGRPKEIADGSGTRAMGYHDSGQVSEERYTEGLFNGLSVERTFDSLHRLSGLALASGSSPHAVAYTHDAASRLHTITHGNTTATYAYLANSPLVETVTFHQSGNTRLTTTKVYDKLNRLASITNTPSSSSASSFNYAYNAANQRVRATREDSSYWAYGYDTLGQVTSGKKHRVDATVINGLDYEWIFDDIGNRRSATRNASSSEALAKESYTANSLNQYSQRTVPGVIDVHGTADADATVTITYPASAGAIYQTNRQGEGFSRSLLVDNTTTAVNAQLKVTGVRNLVGPDGEDAVAEEIRTAFVPQTPEIYAHDADGNLIADARWAYTWDAENRLVSMETQSGIIVPNGPLLESERMRLEFTYDGQSRRVAKKVFKWESGDWALDTYLQFAYDGWNMIAEFRFNSSTSTFDLNSRFVWGLDVSGTLQGAGGVGGLLFSTLQLPTSTSTNAPAFDGNGNVIGLVDMATGERSATYEYNAYGETVLNDGAAATNNPFRFSSKYTDREASHLYYGFRYYTPSNGRWLSKDPIEENGGVNLFGMVGNNPISFADPLGLALHAFDGTGNSRSNGSNIVILHDIYRGARHYYQGVGSGFGARAVGGLTGFGGRGILEGAYRNFIQDVKNGDGYVDIIGFSRGGVMAREFANMIHERGYRDGALVTTTRGGRRRVIYQKGGEKPDDCTIIIRFVGLFDSVGSFGVPGNGTNIGYRSNLPGGVQNAAQATAQDERRLLFPLTPLNPAGPGQNFSEQSFPGDHSDNGRGHGSDTNDLSRAPLEYIWNQGRAAGVPFGPLPPYTPTGNTTPHDLSTGPSGLWGLLPTNPR